MTCTHRWIKQDNELSCSKCGKVAHLGSITQILRREFEDGKILISSRRTLKIKGISIEAYPEPWRLECFTNKELKEAKDEHDLENLVIERSKQIAKKEGWHGSEYFYPDESGEPYGVTLFYKVINR